MMHSATALSNSNVKIESRGYPHDRFPAYEGIRLVRSYQWCIIRSGKRRAADQQLNDWSNS